MKAARDMTTGEIGREFYLLQQRFDALRSDAQLCGGGSPGEGMVERMDELETELRRRKAAV